MAWQFCLEIGHGLGQEARHCCAQAINVNRAAHHHRPKAPRALTIGLFIALPAVLALADSRIVAGGVHTMEIQLDVAQAAIALSEWCGQVAAPLLNELEVREPIYDDVMSRIRRAGGRMPTRDLVRMLRNKYPARLIQEAKEQLLYSQDLEKGLSGGLEVVKLAKTKQRDVC